MFCRLSSHQNLALVLALLWVSTILTFVGYNYLDPQLPQSILTEIQNFPTHAIAINFGKVALGILAIASLLMFMQKNSGRMLFLVGIIVLLAHDYLIGPTARNTYYAIFEDGSYTLLGVIVALIWSDPIKQLFSNHAFNLAKVSYLRILCGLILALFCVGVYWHGHVTMPTDMQIFLNHSKQMDLIAYNNFFISVMLILMISAPIALCLQLNIARYLFIVWVILDIICGGSDVQLGGLASVNDRLLIINSGIIVALIFCAPLKDQFNQLNWKRNFMRTMVLSLFSQKIYQETVHEKTGTGFIYLLFTSLLVSTISVVFALSTSPTNILNTTNKTYIQSQLPDFDIQHGLLSIDRPSPLTIYNKAGNPVAIIDTSGKINNFQAIPPTVTVLVTQKNVFLLKHNNNQITIKILAQNLSDGNYSSSAIMSKLNVYIYSYCFYMCMYMAFIAGIFLYLLSCLFALRPVFDFFAKTRRSRGWSSQKNIPHYAEKLDATLSVLDYNARLRINVVAASGVLLLLSFFYAYHKLHPSLLIIALLIYLSSIAFGVRSNLEE